MHYLVWQDMHYRARIFAKKPGSTLVAVMTLALGIRVNTAVCSLANAPLQSPLHYAQTEQQAKIGVQQKAVDFVKVENRDSVQPVSKSPPALTTDDVTVFFDALLPLLLRRDEIAGAVVAVVKDGRVLFAKGYGYADVAAIRPVSADATLFRVASISKLFTWTAVMQLVKQGKLDLDRQ
jgi:CubicO group peptidase (beta-lactamase class C family)